MKRQRSEADVHRAADGSDLVTFNVSGKIYTVLREPTLSLHPNSLLTQLAEEKGNEKEIFVEGDQDLFKYVLEYHRDRKILLPPMISKEAVLREVKRFGLDLAPEEIVEDGVCLPSVRAKTKVEKDRLVKERGIHTAALLANLIVQKALEKSMAPAVGTVQVSSQEAFELLFPIQFPEDKCKGLKEVFYKSVSCVFLGCETAHVLELLNAWARSFGYEARIEFHHPDHFMASFTPIA